MRAILIIGLLAVTVSGSVKAQSIDFYNLYFAGNAALVKENWDDAIDKYTEALELSEEDYVYYNRGNALFGSGDLEGALEDYNDCLLYNSQYAEAYYQRGLVKLELDDDDGACDDFKSAKKLDLSGASTMYNKHCK